MPIREPYKIGSTFIATGAPNSYVGQDAYGAGIRPPDTLDVVEYNEDYNFSPFTIPGYVPGYSTAFRYDPGYQNEGDRDVFIAIERVEFTNGMYLIEGYNTPAFAIEGLYDYLGRETPERAGFEFWLDGYDRGVALKAIVDDFIAIKAEAAKTGVYGITEDPADNRAFVEALYQDVLSYGGTEEGIQFWSGNLDDGLADRSDVLIEFVKAVGESPAATQWIEWA